MSSVKDVVMGSSKHFPSLSKSLRAKAISLIRERGLRPLAVAMLNVWDEIKFVIITQFSIRSLAALRGERGLKVELGCGPNIRLGWVNIDLGARFPSEIDPTVHSDTMVINYDLRRGLPLEEGSCDYIYSSHFFEHLEYQHGLKLMRDCYRALRPGGVFRIVLPNYRGAFEAYLRGDYEYFELIDSTFAAACEGQER